MLALIQESRTQDQHIGCLKCLQGTRDVDVRHQERSPFERLGDLAYLTIPTTFNMRPATPCSPRCEKYRIAPPTSREQAVHSPTTVICASFRPASSNCPRLACQRSR